MLNNSSILVTGGTGSFGHSFAQLTLKKYNPNTFELIGPSSYDGEGNLE